MNPAVMLGILAIVVTVILIVRIVGPYSRHIYRRTRLHGPIPTGGGPGGSGTAWGWMLTAIWSVGETKREETYEYLRGTTTAKTESPKEWQGLVDPKPAQLPAGDAMLPRSGQSLTDDRQQWWSGREWVRVGDFVPSSAERSVDGEQWWDGEHWQWVPHTFAPPSSWAPRPAVIARIQRDQSPTTWVIENRRHLADRWAPDPPPPPPDRSDPPPEWLA